MILHRSSVLWLSALRLANLNAFLCDPLLYRVALKSLGARSNMLIVECQVTFAPHYTLHLLSDRVCLSSLNAQLWRCLSLPF